MKRIVSIIALLSLMSLALIGCSTQTKPPAGYDLNATQTSLAEASYSVSRSVVDLAETAEANHPQHPLDPPPSPASYGMGGLTSIDWSGPVEPLVQQIAQSANYRIRVLGTAPAIPVMITIYAQNEMLGDILRDVGYQCGRRARLVVFPGSRVIELRYAKN